jgi:hypothetical protein
MNDELIVLYVDGVEMLALANSIYIPRFEQVDVECGSESLAEAGVVVIGLQDSHVEKINE